MTRWDTGGGTGPDDGWRARAVGIGVVGMFLVIAACGGGDPRRATTSTSISTGAATTAPSDVSTVAPEPPASVPSTTAAPAPPADAAPPVDPADLPAPRRVVSSVLDELPEANGWRLAAGPWTSTAFGPGLTFDLPSDVLLVDQSPDAIELTPVVGGPSARLSILVPNAVGGDAGIAVAVPNDPVGYLEDLDEQGIIDLFGAELFRAPDGSDGFVADFAAFALSRIGLEQFGTYRCDRGSECIYIMHTTAGADIQAIEGESIRVVGRTIDGQPYRVVARGPAGPDFDRLATEAFAVANSLARLDDTPPIPDRQLLAMAGTRSAAIPPGDYVTRLGAAVVEISVTPELGPLALEFAGQESIRLDVDGVGVVRMNSPAWVDPVAEQSDEPPSSDDFLDDPILTLAAYREWLTGFVDAEEVARVQVDGYDAVSLDGPLSDDAPAWPCALDTGPERDRCVWLTAFDRGWWYGNDLPNAIAGAYFIDRTGLMLMVDPVDATADVTEALQPFLDAITIRLLPAP